MPLYPHISLTGIAIEGNRGWENPATLRSNVYQLGREMTSTLVYVRGLPALGDPGGWGRAVRGRSPEFHLRQERADFSTVVMKLVMKTSAQDFMKQFRQRGDEGSDDLHVICCGAHELRIAMSERRRTLRFFQGAELLQDVLQLISCRDA